MLGLAYRTKFGGDFAIGQTIPYVLQERPVRRMGRPGTDGRRCSRERRHRRLWSRRRAASRRPWTRRATRSRSSTRRRSPSTACRRTSRATRSAATARTRRSSGGPAREEADLFLALTEGDNRNVMSAQIAAEVFDAKRVIAKINDPLRAEAYAELGIATICRTDAHGGRDPGVHRPAHERRRRASGRRPEHIRAPTTHPCSGAVGPDGRRPERDRRSAAASREG